MKKKISIIALLIVLPGLLGVLVYSCGGDSKEAEEPYANINVEEEEVEWENVELSAAEKAEFAEGAVKEEPVASGGTGEENETSPASELGTGTGPGTMKLVLKVLGEEAAGEVRVFKNDADQTVVEKGAGKSTYVFSLSPGSYNIDAVYREAINEPKLSLTSVQVPAGGKVERTFNFPMAQVKFVPVKSGTNQVVKGYKLRLKAKGGEDWYQQTFTPGNDFVNISPGNYEGELFKGSKKKEKIIPIPGIQVNEGSKATKRIDVNL
ncbi:MAG: hypothetical protein ABIJ56_06755 [Pseudomonadota bacterium]